MNCFFDEASPYDSCTPLSSPSLSLLFPLALLPQSKKIHKTKYSSTSTQASPCMFNFSPELEDSDDELLMYSRYCVFEREEKDEILKLMKEFLLETLSIKRNKKTHDWLDYLERLEDEEFFSFIKKELPIYVRFLSFLKLD